MSHSRRPHCRKLFVTPAEIQTPFSIVTTIEKGVNFFYFKNVTYAFLGGAIATLVLLREIVVSVFFSEKL